MTNTKDKPTHRLVDMVVEEVSLVDRAANKHRFLIVKRSDLMNPDAAKTGENSETGPGSSPEVLSVAVAALERLTEAVETLNSNGGDPARLMELATELKSFASKLDDAAPHEGTFAQHAVRRRE